MLRIFIQINRQKLVANANFYIFYNNHNFYIFTQL